MDIAVQKGHSRVIDFYKNLLSDKNPKDSNDSTPLHLAASNGHVKVVKYLIQHVEDIHPKTGEAFGHTTPFHLANAKGHTAIANILKPCKTAKSIKKAKRREEENDIENILQNLGIDDEVEKDKSKKKAKKKSKKSKKLQVPPDLLDEEDSEPEPCGAAAVIDSTSVQEKEEEEEDECSICFELRNQTYMFYPCGYATFCIDCASHLFKSEEKKCPDCRALIKDTIRVFGTIRKP